MKIFLFLTITLCTLSNLYLLSQNYYNSARDYLFLNYKKLKEITNDYFKNTSNHLKNIQEKASDHLKNIKEKSKNKFNGLKDKLQNKIDEMKKSDESKIDEEKENLDQEEKLRELLLRLQNAYMEKQKEIQAEEEKNNIDEEKKENEENRVEL